jgi:hypothetical protein
MLTFVQAVDAYEKLTLETDADELGEPAAIAAEAEAVNEIIVRAMKERRDFAVRRGRGRRPRSSPAALARVNRHVAPVPLRATFAIDANVADDEEEPDN